MTDDITRTLQRIEEGDPSAAEDLLPLVYEELRKLAARQLADEAPGHTLESTALVHEAYLRLANADESVSWNHRGHFFAAAAQAMRRILIDHARGRRAEKRGGAYRRVDFQERHKVALDRDDELMALDEALQRLEAVRPDLARLVMLRYFGGQTMSEAAATLAIPLRTAERNWTYVKAWLKQAMTQGE